jgi:hypothetical protein
MVFSVMRPPPNLPLFKGEELYFPLNALYQFPPFMKEKARVG